MTVLSTLANSSLKYRRSNSCALVSCQSLVVSFQRNANSLLIDANLLLLPLKLIGYDDEFPNDEWPLTPALSPSEGAREDAAPPNSGPMGSPSPPPRGRGPG